jgi:hypothetical protein
MSQVAFGGDLAFFVEKSLWNNSERNMNPSMDRGALWNGGI